MSKMDKIIKNPPHLLNANGNILFYRIVLNIEYKIIFNNITLGSLRNNLVAAFLSTLVDQWN